MKALLEKFNEKKKAYSTENALTGLEWLWTIREELY